MAFELMLVDEFIGNLLQNDAQLNALIGKRVYARKATQNATFPLIVHGAQSTGGVGVVDNPRIMGDHIWLVRGIDKGNDPTKLEPIAARIMDLLSDARQVNTSRGLVYGSIINQPFIMLENGEGGDPDYLHLGATFRILVEPIA